MATVGTDTSLSDLRWEFAGISKLTFEGAASRVWFLAGVPWRFEIAAEMSEENVKHLAIYLHCNDEHVYNSTDPAWSVDSKFTARIFCHNDKGDWEHSKDLRYADGDQGWGTNKFINWEALMDPEEGFVKDDRIIVEVDITVLSTSGIRPQLSIDFSRPPDFGSDSVALRMDDDRVFHVAKGYLATLSPVFKALFFSEFQEKAQPEIALKEIASEEFEELLNVIYPSYHEVTSWSYPFLLALADQFQIASVTERAEEWLLRTSIGTQSKKLQVADRFRLDRLMLRQFTIDALPSEHFHAAADQGDYDGAGSGRLLIHHAARHSEEKRRVDRRLKTPIYRTPKFLP